jgi:hypothetical protein
VGQEGKEKR